MDCLHQNRRVFDVVQFINERKQSLLWSVLYRTDFKHRFCLIPVSSRHSTSKPRVWNLSLFLHVNKQQKFGTESDVLLVKLINSKYFNLSFVYYYHKEKKRSLLASHWVWLCRVDIIWQDLLQRLSISHPSTERGRKKPKKCQKVRVRSQLCSSDKISGKRLTHTHTHKTNLKCQHVASPAEC